MISAPESQQIDRYSIDEPIGWGLVGITDIGACGGLGYGMYLGVKVTACDAACKTACNSGACSVPFCPDPCSALTCKTLECFGISTGMFLAGGVTAMFGALAIGCCYLTATKRVLCPDCIDSDNETSEKTECESQSDRRGMDDDTVRSDTTEVESRPDVDTHGNESFVITSQPTARHSQAINGSDSTPSHLHPEVRYTSDATAMNNGHSSTDDYPASALYCAPPSYEESVGPPPSYE